MDNQTNELINNEIKNNFFISPNKKILNAYTLILNKINSLENDIKLSIDDIKEGYKKWLKEYMVN